MTNSPTKRSLKTVTKDELESLYVEHHFDEVLASCVPIIICDEQFVTNDALPFQTVAIRGIKYRLDGKTIAVIFRYSQADGTTRRSIRMLVINDVLHAAAQYP